jgi:hypothetical protein
MMQGKRSLSVTLIAWGLTIYYALILILPFLNPRRCAYNLFDVFHPPLQLVWVISSVILVGFVVSGIQILKLKEFGRSLFVFLAIIDIPHLVVGKAIYNNFGIVPLYIRNSFLIPVSVAINLILIYFFSHPRAKQQFK